VHDIEETMAFIMAVVGIDKLFIGAELRNTITLKKALEDSNVCWQF